MKAEIGAQYRHFKNGKEYRVIGIAHHSETLEEVVVYEALYESPDFGKNALWVRPRALFEEVLTIEGKTVHRFIRVDKVAP